MADFARQRPSPAAPCVPHTNHAGGLFAARARQIRSVSRLAFTKEHLCRTGLSAAHCDRDGKAAGL